MKYALNKSYNDNKTQMAGKYVTLIESNTPWFKSKELTKKNIKKNKKYPHKCKCNNYLNLNECHCTLEHMVNIENDNINKNITNNKKINKNLYY